MPMLSQEFEKSLSQIEQQLSAVFEAIHRGDPVTLEVASDGLRQVSIDFSRMMDDRPETLSDQGIKRRLKKIVKDMVILRENLMRRMVGVTRSLDVLMPEARHTATYAKPVGSHGAAHRQAGTFRQYSA